MENDARWADLVGFLVLLGILLMVLVLGDQRDMERLSVRSEIDGLRRELARLKEHRLPDVIVHRGSVYTGSGEVVIQGFDEDVKIGPAAAE